MRSPTAALLWAIWRRHRTSVWAIIGFTVVGWLVHFSELASRPPGATPDPSPLVELLAIFSFLLLVGIFGQFPRRLFTLPVSSLRLVAVPVLAGIASVELFYAAWREPLSRVSRRAHCSWASCLRRSWCSTRRALDADRAGALRIVLAGTVGILVFGVGLLPSFPPTPPPQWRREGALT